MQKQVLLMFEYRAMIRGVNQINLPYIAEQYRIFMGFLAVRPWKYTKPSVGLLLYTRNKIFFNFALPVRVSYVDVWRADTGESI